MSLSLAFSATRPAPSWLRGLLLVLTFLAAGISSAALANESLWHAPAAYLGQTPPSEIPKPFAPGLLTDPGTFTMGRVAFSSDGREFYYTQGDSWNSLEHAKIKMMAYDGHQWRAPVVVNEQFVSPTLSIDGSALYFRQGNMHNVWQSHRVAGGWSAPAAFLDTKFGLYDFMPTRSGTFYVGSDPDTDDASHGSTMVFSTLTLSGTDMTVHSLGRPLNKPGFNGDLYIAPDESYIIISTNETETFESELYISFRQADLTWSEPQSLGPQINDGLAHRWGQYVSPDGKYLFYSHGTSEKDCAIYWVRFDTILRNLRHASAAPYSSKTK